MSAKQASNNKLENFVNRLKSKEHLEKSQVMWDTYLTLLRYYSCYDDQQKRTINKAKACLLNNRVWR